MDSDTVHTIKGSLRHSASRVDLYRNFLDDPRWRPDRSAVLSLVTHLEQTLLEAWSLMAEVDGAGTQPESSVPGVPEDEVRIMRPIARSVGADGEGAENEWIRRAHEQNEAISASEVEFFAELKRRRWLGLIAAVPSADLALVIQHMAHMRLTGGTAACINGIVDKTIEALLDEHVHTDPVLWPIDTAPRDRIVRAVQVNSEGEILNHCMVEWRGESWEIEIERNRPQVYRPCGDTDALTHWIDPLGFKSAAQPEPEKVVAPSNLPAALSDDAVERVARTACLIGGNDPDQIVPYLPNTNSTVSSGERPRWENYAVRVRYHHAIYAAIIQETLSANQGEMQDWLRGQIGEAYGSRNA